MREIKENFEIGRVLKKISDQAVVVHTFNLSTWEAEASGEFKASLVYGVSPRTGSKATQRNPVLKNKTKPKTQARHGDICLHTQH